MKTENSKITYRRATVDDVQTLIDMRVRFLNELYSHLENDETKILRKSLRQYFSEAIPSGSFIAWLAEHEGKTVGTAEWLCGRCQEGTKALRQEDSDTFSTCTLFLNREEVGSAHDC